MMGISVAIVEDDKFYNDTLKKVLDYHPDLHCSGQFYTGKSALDNIPDLRPDVVLMDLQLRDSLGSDVISKLLPKLPRTNFIVCSNHEEEDKIFDSLKAGAIGYLIKGESLEKIVDSILDAYNGASPMSNSIGRKVLKYFQNQNEEKQMLQTLTKSETEILSQISKGYMYKEIADIKSISTETVKKHIANIYKKLGVNNKIEAVNKFNQK